MLDNSRNRMIYVRQFFSDLRLLRIQGNKRYFVLKSFFPSFALDISLPCFSVLLSFLGSCACNSYSMIHGKTNRLFAKVLPRRRKIKRKNNLKILPLLLNFFNVISVEIKTLTVRSWHDMLSIWLISKPRAWEEETERRNKLLLWFRLFLSM